MRTIIAVALVAMSILLVAQVASASPPESWQWGLDFKPHPFADWSWEEIQAYPGFFRFADESQFADGSPEQFVAKYYLTGPSQTTIGAEPGAPLAYQWVGFIVLEFNSSFGPDGKPHAFVYSFVVFDQSGAGVTMVNDHGNPYDDGYVPTWFRGTVQYLYDVGYFEGYL